MDATRSVAQRGLRDSQRAYLQFWKTRELRTAAAEHSLQQIAAVGDFASQNAVALAAALAPQAADDPKTHLRLMQATLSAVAAGVSAGAAPMAALALNLHQIFSASEVVGNRSQAAGGALLGAIATREAQPYTAFLCHLAEAGASSEAALQAATRPAPQSASAYAALALSLAAGSAPVVHAALADIASFADSSAPQQLERLRRFQALPLGQPTHNRLELATLQRIESGAPADAQSTLTYAAEASRKAPTADSAALAAQALAEAEQAHWPTDSPLPAWLALRRRLAAVGGAPLDVAVLAAAADGQPADLPAIATAAFAVATAKPDVAVARALWNDLQAVDNKRHDKFFDTINQLHDRLGKDAWRQFMFIEAIGALTKPAAEVGEDALARLGRKLCDHIPDVGEQRNVASIFLESVEELASSRGHLPMQQMALAARKAVAQPQAEDRYNTSLLSECLGQLGRNPSSLAECAAMADRVISSTAFLGDRLRVANGMLAALATVAAAAPDAVGAEKVRILGALAQHSMYAKKEQMTSIQAGLQLLSRPRAAEGYDLAAFATNVTGRLSTPADSLVASAAALDALRRQAQATHDSDLGDAVDFLSRIGPPNVEESQRVTATSSGLALLARKPDARTEPFLGLVFQVLSSRIGSPQKVSVAQAALQVLEARGARKTQLHVQEQARFLSAVAGLHFASSEHLSNALIKGLQSFVKGNGAGEEGLARLAGTVMGATSAFMDQIQVAQMATDAISARVQSGGNADRLEVVRTLQAVVNLDNYEDRYRAAVARTAVNSLARTSDPYPGELASSGLALINEGYYFQNQLQIGDTVVAGMERLAKRQKDTVFTPTLVAEMRRHMAEAKGPREQVKAMRDGLKELSRLKGDEFRKALLQALQAPNAGDAPKIENHDGDLVIGGVKVPKRSVDVEEEKAPSGRTS